MNEWANELMGWMIEVRWEEKKMTWKRHGYVMESTWNGKWKWNEIQNEQSKHEMEMKGKKK